jgi:hypothetical protein
MEKIILEYENLNIKKNKIYTDLPLPGDKIKLKNNNDIFIFIGINKENKYILVNNNVNQIYGNTFICNDDNIEKI